MKLVLNLDDLDNESFYILYIYTDWMIFIKKYNKMLPDLEKEFNVNIFALNADIYKDYCFSIGVDSVPTLIGVYNKKILHIASGAMLKSACKNVFKKIIQLKNKQDKGN